MDSIPNWFRWLIIVLATLIMCACQTPMQDSQEPLTGASSVASVLVRSPQPLVDPAVMQTHHDAANYEVHADVLMSSSSIPVPFAAADSLAEEAEACVAPIIRKTHQRLQAQTLQQATTGTSPARAPVYFHMDDQLFATQYAQPTPATATGTELVSPEMGSPFLDDPGPAPTSVLTPTLDPSFQSPSAPQPPTPGTQQFLPVQPYVVHEALPGVVVGPAIPVEPMVDYAETPPAELIIDESSPALPAPFDYLPQVEIPCNVTPDCWAMVPSATMPVSFGELSRRYPDEYVCDGGDASGEVRVLPDWSIKGLDPEDTVGHYDTLDNRVEVSASNRVCIYAPRFAAVRKVTSPFQNEKYNQALIEQREDVVVTENQELATISYQQSVAAERDIRIQPAVGLQSEVPGITGVYSLPVRVLNKDLSLHEDFRVMKLGIHKQAEKPRLAEYTIRAVTWSADQAVQVVVDGEQAQVNSSVNAIESLHTIGDNRPAKLRVIKTASVADALPGEEVEFTLRFDNVGHQPMGNVTIIDNLTTRLEYLRDTELCSLENDFVVDENEVDSLTLRWEIKDPIQPGKGGLIRFKCRVR